MTDPTVWVYKEDRGWYGHIDWHDGGRVHREGPFVSEAQAQIVISRMNGYEPPAGALAEREGECG